jgi:hypothetical protein
MKIPVKIIVLTFLLPVDLTTAQIQSIPSQRIPATQLSPKARIRYEAPSNQEQQSRRIPGGISNHCLRDARNYGRKNLTDLIPVNNPGLTTSERPTLFFYIPKTPKTSVKAFEFVLMDANEQLIYKGTFKVNNQPGVFSLSLPANSEKSLLEIDQEYRWYFSAICDRSERSRDLVVTGWFKRIASNNNLSAKLKTASPRKRAAVYAASGIWYDSLTTLAQARHQHKSDVELKTDWQELLQSVGLSEIYQEPLLGDLEVK